MPQSSNEARILLALQALKDNPKLTVRRAANIYDVNRSTLGRRQHGILSKRDTPTKSRKLSDQEEQIIVQFILDLDSRGFPSRLSYVEDIANSLCANRDIPPVGKRWAYNFIKRQPELKTRKFRRYDYQRAKCEDPTIIYGWFRLIENTIARYGIRSDDIWNFDETGFMMGVIEPGTVVTSSYRQGRPKQVQPGNREWITVIEGINAEGQSIPPFIIGAGQYHLANWYRECDLPGDWVIATSHNGWTNNQLGLEWLKHFDQATAKRTNSRYRLLILDGHESHHSVEFEEYCKENKIITLYLENVISKLDVQLRTPTPPVEVTIPSTPWTARTPKTVLEAQSHSKYLQGRIRNHKSSSPESIIKAVKHFEKATTVLMDKMVLLHNRNQQLEQQNKIVGRRRRGKRTRVQKEGPLTIGEASQAIDQIDIDAQVTAEASRGGRGRSQGAKVRQCSICGKTGHNARTCQEAIEVNRE
ncbi:transposase [Fusarium oxysporum f. sp. phaseoli]